jgi:hypothetical protein
MKTQKYRWLLAVLAVILSVSIPMSGTLAAPAADPGTADSNVEAGRSYTLLSGRYSALLYRAPKSGIVRLERGARMDHKVGIAGLGENHKFVQELWKIGYVDQDDELVEGYDGLLRLSIALTKEYRTMWQEGELAFYTYNGRSWSRCNAQLIAAGTNGTLICEARGISRFSLVDVVNEDDEED